MRRLKTMSFVAQFVVLSAAVLLVAGMSLAHVLTTLVKERATSDTARLGEALVATVLTPRLERDDFADVFGAARIADMREASRLMTHIKEDFRPLRVKIFNVDGMVVYSDDASLVGRAFPDSPDLQEALSGRVVSAHTTLKNADETSEAAFDEALEVYVPVDLAGDRTVGVVEIYVPWEPVATRIARDRRLVYASLSATLLVFYLVLLRLVGRTSRRLRDSVRRNAHLAFHDALTGLPNRALLADRVERSLAEARRTGAVVALLLIDLDRFKEVNDTLGHDVGDELLCHVADRISRTLREVDTVARLGGDEFVVLLPLVDDFNGVEQAAGRLLEALHQAFDLRGVQLALEASIGIACYPEHGTDAGTLMQHADVAMYAAKEQRGVYRFYDRDSDVSSVSTITLLNELRGALSRDELCLYYQPKEELADGTVRSVEALLRWQHPERGLVMPGDFLPAAEQTGLMEALTDRVLELALRQLKSWEEEGRGLRVSVNLAARNCIDVELPGRLARMADSLGVSLVGLEVEVTETSAMLDPARAQIVLRDLAGMGVSVSIDDYGTGYSSLSYLRSLPVDSLKIDRSFISRMMSLEDDAIIVRSTIDLAHSLGLRVIGEGVEDAGTRTVLRELGCNAIQGFYLSRPLPAPQLERFLDGDGSEAPEVEELSPA